jgi:PAS domain S-box-containing protein
LGVLDGHNKDCNEGGHFCVLIGSQPSRFERSAPQIDRSAKNYCFTVGLLCREYWQASTSELPINPVPFPFFGGSFGGLSMSTPRIGVKRLLFLLVLVAILPSLGMVIYHYHEGKEEAKTRVRDDVKQALTLAQAGQENIIAGVRAVLETVASVPSVRRTDLRHLCVEFLGNLRDRPSQLANIGFASLDGDVRCHALGTQVQPNIADRDYFRRAVGGAAFTIGNFMVGRVTQKPVLGFAMPVLDYSGQQIGVAFVTLDLQSNFRQLKELGLEGNFQIDLLDSDGLLLASNHAPESAIGIPFQEVLEEAAPEVDRPAGVASPSGSQTTWIRQIRTFGDASSGLLQMVVSARLEDQLAPIVTRLKQQLLILAAASILGLLLAWYMAYRFVGAPLGELHRRMKQDSWSEAVGGSTFRSRVKEFADLETGFRQMVGRLQKKEDQLNRVQRLAGMGFYVLDLKAGLMQMNETASSMLGLSDARLETEIRSVAALLAPADRRQVTAQHLRVAETGEESRLILRVNLPDGRTRWMENFCLRQSGHGGHDAMLCGALQDISERQRLQRMYAVQSRVNEMLLGADRVSDIFQTICNIAVVVGKLKMVCFCQYDEDSGHLTPLASAEGDQISNDRPAQRSDCSSHSHEVGLAAIRNERVVVFNDIAQAHEQETWAAAALAKGYRSAAAVPVHRTNRIHGALIFMSAEVGHFEEDEQTLLASIARSVSNALDALDTKNRRQEAEAELRLLQRSVDNLNDAVLITGVETQDELGPRIIYVNQAFERMTGYSAAEVIGRSPRFLQREESRTPELERVREALSRWEPVRAEILSFTKSGQRIWLDMNMVPLEGLDGQYTHWVAVERDITERKMAQQKEEELFRSFRLLFENNPQPMWVFEVSTRHFLQVNHAACEQYGYTQEEFSSMTVEDILSLAERARMRQRLATTDSHGRGHAGVWLHSEKSGRLRHVDITTQRLVYEGKEAELVVAVDLSERVRMEREREQALLSLKKTAARLDRAQVLAQMGSWERTVGDGSATWSKSLYRIMGRDLALGPPTLEDARRDAHPEDLEGYVATMRAALEGQPVPRSRYRSVHGDGSVHWYEETFDEPVRDDDGKVVSISGTVQDITHQVEAQEQLQMQLYRTDLLNQIARATEERRDLTSVFRVVCEKLDALFSVELSAVFLRSGDATVTVAQVGENGAALAREAGITQGTILAVEKNGLARCLEGKPVYERDLSTLPFALPQALASIGLRSLVLIPLQSGGETFGVLIAARRGPDGFDSGACEFMRQLGEHVALAATQGKLLDSLQRAYNELQEAQQTVIQQERLRVLGHMASGIAHDINNALSPVSLYTEALLMREDAISQQGRQQLQTIQLAVDDVAETVARLQEFYRPMSGAERHMAIDMNRVVQQTVDRTRVRWRDRSQASKHTIELELKLMEHCPPALAAEGEVRDALVNLVFNACDAMPEGGVLSITTRIQRDETGQSWLEVSVADTGCGMDAETKARCIEPFFTTKGERGTGLGLAMVFGCMKRHGGSLHVDSEPDRGTRVALRFPEQSTAGPMIATDQSALNKPVMPRRLKVLVVDDELQVRAALSEILELEGHQVVCVSNGEDALRAFTAATSAEPFSLVITDLGMPGMDGREVAARIKEARMDTPVVMLTGWGRRMEQDRDTPPGVDHLMSKPPTLSALLSVFAELGLH